MTEQQQQLPPSVVANSVWEWEPLSAARERTTIVTVKWNGEEWWIKSIGDRSGPCWNTLDRWTEAAVLVTPAEAREHGFKRACECGRATDDRCDYCAAYIPREGTLGVRGHLVNLLDALDSDEDDPIYADQLATAEEQARNALREGRFVTCGRCKADKIPVVGLGDHADNCPDCGSLIGRARQDGFGATESTRSGDVYESDAGIDASTIVDGNDANAQDGDQ